MKPSANRKNGQRGFAHSQTDILYVVAVIAIAAAILVPNFIRARAQGQLTACKSNLRNLATALEIYQGDHEHALPTNLQALTPEYLKRIPECPSGERITYFATFGPGAPFNDEGVENYVLIECMGDHHSGAALDANYPKHSSKEGLLFTEK